MPSKKHKKSKTTHWIFRWWHKISDPIARRIKKLLTRRPHRSFRLTRRRDYKRSLKLPGYWSFTNEVRHRLWQNRRLFGGLILVYAVAIIIINSFGAQDAYSQLSDTLKSSGGDLFKGNFGSVTQAGLLLASTVNLQLFPDISRAQTAQEGVQWVTSGLAAFLIWLSTIWLLRNTMAGHKPRLRDGLYNSGSPILATVLVGFVLTLQMIPAALAVLVYLAAEASGLLENGVSAMLVWTGVILMSLVTLYWITSTIIAMVVTTLPGMYPMQSIKAAGDLVIGRRLRILFRWLWLLVIIGATWCVIMIPIILFDDWVKQLVPAIKWLPLVPLAVIAMGSLTIVYVTSYIYMLYRRIVDDDAAPA